MHHEEYTIWSNSPDTSEEGIAEFCKFSAGRYNKTPDEMSRLPLSQIIGLMWDDIQSWRLAAYAALDLPTAMPIFVVADRAGEELLSKPEISCFILSGNNLNQILDIRSGISTTFYSDGSNIRCRDIGENGADYYLFREMTNLNGMRDFVERVERGEAFTESELDEFSRSLSPTIHQIYGWPEPGKLPLEKIIVNATDRSLLKETPSVRESALVK